MKESLVNMVRQVPPGIFSHESRFGKADSVIEFLMGSESGNL
jgi:hypothetical protein